MNVLVTGGAGFIGSHLADALLTQGHDVTVLDNLSQGQRRFVSPRARFLQLDLVTDTLSTSLQNVDVVFHFAADPDVRASASNTRSSFDNNVLATFRLLEACRQQDVRRIVFASTSAVYGETQTIPTPETCPLAPISNYGAGKSGSEAYLSSFAASYGIQSTILRFANVFGERGTHGVMYDFFHKLRKNPEQLEILGNGRQEKSYLHVSDAVSATLTAWKKQTSSFDIYNVGSRQKTSVSSIAEKMSGILKLKPGFRYTGGERGWAGDVPVMLLDTKKLEALGWKAEVPFEDGLKRYVEWLSRDFPLV